MKAVGVVGFLVVVVGFLVVPATGFLVVCFCWTLGRVVVLGRVVGRVADWGLAVVCLTTGLFAGLFWALDCLILTGFTGGSATGLPAGFFTTAVAATGLRVGLGAGLGAGLLTKEAETGLAAGLLATGLTAAGLAAGLAGCLGAGLGVVLDAGVFTAAAGLALFGSCCWVFCVVKSRSLLLWDFASVNVFV